MRRILAVLFVISFNCTALISQPGKSPAPGAPGSDAHWPTAAKNGLGTANTLRSKVWFTLAEGVLTEVYYPTLDTPNVQILQLIVVTPEGNVETEKEDTIHSIAVLDQCRSLSFQQENRARSGAYVIHKTYVTDTQRDVVLIQVSFRSRNNDAGAYKLFVYYDPSVNNSGMHDSAWTKDDALLAQDTDKASALIAGPAFDRTSNGYLGVSDALTQLRVSKEINHYERAVDGNVVQVGRLTSSGNILGQPQFTLVLGFGKTAAQALTNARASLASGFYTVQKRYQAGWHAYTARLPKVEGKYRRQFSMAAMVLIALEDKTHRGGMIASPSIPWGGGANANEPTVSGYHAVWSRDLYHVATAFLAIGNRAPANRALDHLFTVQQRPDGSFPQNARVDGRQLGGGLQLDQVALPLILAYQLGRTDRQTWLRHIKPAARFILRQGPATGQDRWEEKPGYSPATIAAEIAGLVCAAEIARINKDYVAARSFLETADNWEKTLDSWTATKSGPFGRGEYYLRITENDNPNDGARTEINSGGGIYDEREIVDAGFLELVRLGIRAPGNALVVNSLAVVDKLIKIPTPGGDGWYRYNHDAYGESSAGGPFDGRNGVGRLWSLLTGERGEYELALGQKHLAQRRLDTMLGFANDGMMIPEQVWDRNSHSGFSGTGTGSATPLAWSMAQFIRLLKSIENGRNVETPDIVVARYLGQKRVS